MPRPIVMTNAMKRKAKKEFAAMLDGMKMSDGSLNYNQNFRYKNCGATVWLTPEAYRKTLALVTGFSDEVGWHGTVSRAGNDEFIIEDIYVYPQEVTGSTVNTDQAEYVQWLYGQEDAVFDKIRMQGHSHVNMSVSPSGVDDKHRAGILEQLEKDMFYIFMIWNKSLSVHTLIYDLARNVLYEDGDVTVQLLGDEDMDVFLADAMEKVQKKSFNDKRKQSPGRCPTQEYGFGLNPAAGDYTGDFMYRQYGLYDPYEAGGETWKP